MAGQEETRKEGPRGSRGTELRWLHVPPIHKKTAPQNSDLGLHGARPRKQGGAGLWVIEAAPVLEPAALQMRQSGGAALLVLLKVRW